MYIDLSRAVGCDPPHDADSPYFELTNKTRLNEPPPFGAYRRVNMEAFEYLYYSESYLETLSGTDGKTNMQSAESLKTKYVPEYAAFHCRTYWLTWVSGPNKNTPPYPKLYVAQAPVEDGKKQYVPGPGDCPDFYPTHIVPESLVCNQNPRQQLGVAKREYYVPFLNAWFDDYGKAKSSVVDKLEWSQIMKEMGNKRRRQTNLCP